MLMRRRVLWMLFGGWPLLSLLANGGRMHRWLGPMQATTTEVLGEMFVWAALGIVLSVAVWSVWRRWMAEAELSSGNVVVLFGLCVVAGLVFESAERSIGWPMAYDLGPRGRMRPSWTQAFLPGAAIFAWVSTQILLDTQERVAATRARALRAEALATESRLTMLRHELNPHFLFNALNSIIGVISEDRAKAQHMVRQLAGLLRHALYSPEVSTVTAEVAVAERYLAIEQLRFEERLQVAVDVAPEVAEVPVPAMLLQPLVENAVKHGMGEAPLHIRIEAQPDGARTALVVRHRGTLGPTDRGVGLRNLRDRLALDDSAFDIAQLDDDVVATIRVGRTP
jgi:signal transduction histidine kinase